MARTGTSIPATGGSIAAVARHTILHCLRMKVVGGFMVAIAITVGAMPFLMSGDGTLAGRARSFLSYGTSLVGAFLSILTVFLTIWVITEDIRSRQIYSVIVKPLARWQYVLGRWLGVCILNAALLTVAGAGVYGLAAYLRSGAVVPPSNPEDRQAMETQVFVARAEADPEGENVEALLEERLREMRDAGQLEDALQAFRIRTGGDEDAAQDAFLDEIRKDIESGLYSIPPRGSKRWTFSGIQVRGARTEGIGEIVVVDQKAQYLVVEVPSRLQANMLYGGPITIAQAAGRVMRFDEDRVVVEMALEEMQRPAVTMLSPGDEVAVAIDPVVQLRVRATMARTSSDQRLTGTWVITNPVDNATQFQKRRDLNKAPATITISSVAISDDGRTEVTFYNRPHPDTGEISSVMILPDDIVILYRVGGFSANYVRGLILLMLQLAYLSGMAVFAASFLTFPVACLLTFSLLPFSVGGQFLRDAVNPEFLPSALTSSYWIVNIMTVVLPDFLETSPGRWLVEGMAIPWSFVGKTALLTLCVRTIPMLMVSCLIFWRRELAKVQV
jgi:hypothetical protein